MALTDHSEPKMESTKSQSQVILSLATFLMFFQLIYKVSDRAIECILLFLRTFIKQLARVTACERLAAIAITIPKSIYQVRKIFGYDSNSFKKFAVCPKCSTCFELTGPTLNSTLTCSAESRRNRRCGAALFKKVKCKSSYKFVPKKVFVYHPLKKSLTKLFQREEFHALIEQWRKRVQRPNVMSDVYDGMIWKELSEDRQFLSAPYNLCLKLNVDWFKIYDNVNYSVGVIYLSIDNLPRDKRFNMENIVIVGCIPGPTEPKLNVNSFLAPLVEELNEFWNGVLLKTGSFLGYTSVRCMLTSVSADIPATRKICGFASHSAQRGCSKCLKAFPTTNFGQKPDYSGYDRGTWKLRDHKSHISTIQLLDAAASADRRKELWKEWGIRYSELLKLPYFDIIRYHVVDPMHNLLLGTAKHMISVWKDEKLITNDHCIQMQEIIDEIKVAIYRMQNCRTQTHSDWPRKW